MSEGKNDLCKHECIKTISPSMPTTHMRAHVHMNVRACARIHTHTHKIQQNI